MKELNVDLSDVIPDKIQIKKYGRTEFPSINLGNKKLANGINMDDIAIIWKKVINGEIFLIIQIEKGG